MKRTCLGALVVLVLAACGDVTEVAAGGDADSDVVRSTAGDEPDTPAPAPSAAVEETTAAEEVTAPSAATRQDLEIGETGFSVVAEEYDESLRSLTYAALLSNPNPDTHLATSVDVTISFTDAAGTVVKTASDTATVVLPGQTVAVGDTLFDAPDEVSDMDVQVRVDRWEELDEPVGRLEAHDVTHTAGEFGATTTASVTSTFREDLESPIVVAVYRDAAGAIVGGDFTFAEFFPAGSDIGVEVASTTDVADVASADVYARISGLSLLD